MSGVRIGKLERRGTGHRNVGSTTNRLFKALISAGCVAAKVTVGDVSPVSGLITRAHELNFVLRISACHFSVPLSCYSDPIGGLTVINVNPVGVLQYRCAAH